MVYPPRRGRRAQLQGHLSRFEGSSGRQLRISWSGDQVL